VSSDKAKVYITQPLNELFASLAKNRHSHIKTILLYSDKQVAPEYVSDVGSRIVVKAFASEDHN
jgi:hypothetical protein